jgi:hypothetical protein
MEHVRYEPYKHRDGVKTAAKLNDFCKSHAYMLRCFEREVCEHLRNARNDPPDWLCSSCAKLIESVIFLGPGPTLCATCFTESRRKFEPRWIKDMDLARLSNMEMVWFAPGDHSQHPHLTLCIHVWEQRGSEFDYVCLPYKGINVYLCWKCANAALRETLTLSASELMEMCPVCFWSSFDKSGSDKTFLLGVTSDDDALQKQST